MSAEPRGPSGTGHEDGFERESIPEWVAGMACQSSYPHEAHGSCPVLRRPSDPPVAVPGPACDGSPYCAAPVHIHGCFADYGSCDNPSEHDPPGPASVSPAEPPEDNETQVFEYHVEGVEEQRTYLRTDPHPFDEVYAIRAEHPAEGLEKLLHEIEWGILDSYEGFTITVAKTEELPDD